MSSLEVAASPEEITALAGRVAGAANMLLADVLATVRDLVTIDGALSPQRLEREQAASSGNSPPTPTG